MILGFALSANSFGLTFSFNTSNVYKPPKQGGAVTSRCV
jgi:hypothetical protein